MYRSRFIIKASIVLANSWEKGERMTHQEMVDTIVREMEKKFIFIAELGAKDAASFVFGVRRIESGFRKHVYLPHSEQEFLSAPCELKENTIAAQLLCRTLNCCCLDFSKNRLFEAGVHVRMVIPDTPVCRQRLESLAKTNPDWPRYCLLLDELATSLTADLSVAESFCVLKDRDTPEENKTIC